MRNLPQNLNALTEEKKVEEIHKSMGFIGIVCIVNKKELTKNIIGKIDIKNPPK